MPHVFDVTYPTWFKISATLINLSPRYKLSTISIKNYFPLNSNLSFKSKLHKLGENTSIFHTLAHVLSVHYAQAKQHIRVMYEFRNTLMRIGESVHVRHANVYMFATQMCTLSPEQTLPFSLCENSLFFAPLNKCIFTHRKAHLCN